MMSRHTFLLSNNQGRVLKERRSIMADTWTIPDDVLDDISIFDVGDNCIEGLKLGTFEKLDRSKPAQVVVHHTDQYHAKTGEIVKEVINF